MVEAIEVNGQYFGVSESKEWLEHKGKKYIKAPLQDPYNLWILVEEVESKV